MAHVERLRIHPVKALDAVEVESARITDGGTLEGDREYALFDADGETINGKRTDRVHRLRSSFDPETRVLTVDDADSERVAFHLDDEREAAAGWFGDVLDADVEIRRDGSIGYVDRRRAGPSVVSTATLEALASWFDDLTVESARRRLRANVEVGGVPAFWEDRFVGEDAPAFVAGGVRFEGVEPCGRCIVPERDPDTGERTPDFRERFAERREATFPPWADPDAFDHYYTLMLIAGVPATDRGETVRVGDAVDVRP